MRRPDRSSLLGVAFAALAATSPASAADLPVVGTGDGMDMLSALGSLFSAERPGTQVLVPASIGSGGAVVAVGSGRETLGRVARPLTPSEEELGLVATPIMRIPSVIYVHPSAGVSDLPAGDVVRLFSGEVENWSEVGGSDLKVKVVRREDTDSTLAVLRASMPGWRDLAFTRRSKTATTTQDAMETVRNVPGAIGFGPLSKSQAGNTVALRVGGVGPADEAYPSAVTVSLLSKRDTLTPEAAAFLAFARSPKARGVLRSMGSLAVAP